MARLTVQIRPWDQLYSAELAAEPQWEIGQRVIIEHEDGQDVASVVPPPEDDSRLKTVKIVRAASPEDLAGLALAQNSAVQYLEVCRSEIHSLGLDMKLVACHVSLDRSKIIFGFSANGRIDFRELARRLTQGLRSTIRLQQINARDRLKICGDIGVCGRPLCCQGLIRNVKNPLSLSPTGSSNIRGCDRPTGACGRLKCCLAFEGAASN